MSKEKWLDKVVGFYEDKKTGKITLMYKNKVYTFSGDLNVSNKPFGHSDNGDDER